MHIDDMGLHIIHDSLRRALDAFVYAFPRLVDFLGERLQLGFAMGKFQATGNSKELSKNLWLPWASLGCAGEGHCPPWHYAVKQRPEASAGALRIRKHRWIKAKRRRRRIQSLKPERRAQRDKTSSSGQLSAVAYGEDVTGHAPQFITKLMREGGGQALGILGRGANLNLAWALGAPYKDSIKHQAATLNRYCQEWWAMTDRALAPADGLSLGTLTRACLASSRGCTGGLQAQLGSSGTGAAT
eukprot:1943729-Pyramimonas_sp.AAC.1